MINNRAMPVPLHSRRVASPPGQDQPSTTLPEPTATTAARNAKAVRIQAKNVRSLAN